MKFKTQFNPKLKESKPWGETPTGNSLTHPGQADTVQTLVDKLLRGDSANAHPVYYEGDESSTTFDGYNPASHPNFDFAAALEQTQRLQAGIQSYLDEQKLHQKKLHQKKLLQSKSRPKADAVSRKALASARWIGGARQYIYLIIYCQLTTLCQLVIKTTSN